MKRWLRYAVWTLEVAAVLAVAYFEPTYGVRGVLRGDAFYEGRSTSYWRHRIDRWLDQFEAPEDAIAAVHWTEMAGNINVIDGAVLFTPIKTNSNVMERVRNYLGWGRNEDVIWEPPPVLRGGPSAEPVLEQLERDPAYARLVTGARNRIAGPYAATIRTKSGLAIIVRLGTFAGEDQ